MLKCERKTIANRMKKNPAIASAVNEERQFFLDVTEAKLMEAVNKGEAWAICFTLKTIGRQRGFSERVEFTAMDVPIASQPIINQEINIYDPVRMAKLIAAFADVKLLPADLVDALADEGETIEVSG